MLFFAAWNGVLFYFGRYLDHYGWAMCLAQTITTCTLAIYCVCAFRYMCFFFVVFYPPGVSIALHFFWFARIERAIFHLCAFCTWFILPKFLFIRYFIKFIASCLDGVYAETLKLKPKEE